MINDISELLLDSILLLLHVDSKPVRNNVTKLINIVENDKNKSAFQDVDLLKCLCSLVTELLEKEDTTSKADQAEVLIKFATNKTLSKHTEIKDAITAIFNDNTRLTELKLERMQKKLKNNISWQEINLNMKQMYTKMNKASSVTDELQQEFILSDVVDTAKNLITTDTESLLSTDASLIERIDMTNTEDILPALFKYNESEYTSILRTGFQGLNIACGPRGGLGLGESVNVNGCSGMYKTGILTDLAESITLFNIPPLSIIEQGIPLVLFISLENEANKNMVSWYKKAYARRYGKLPDKILESTAPDVAKFIADTYGGTTGYKLIIEMRRGSIFTYELFQKTVEEYEMLGYRVVCVVVDYLKKMSLSNKLLTTSSKKEDSLINFLFELMCTYTKSKRITFITANQLNREAIAIANSGRPNVCKLFGSQLIGSALGALQEVDLNMFIHLEYNQYGTRFFTLAIDKHRYVTGVPKAHLYYAQPFHEIYGLEYDVNGPPKFTRDLYSVDPPEGYEESSGDSTMNTSSEVF